jgi:hypothetical protein
MQAIRKCIFLTNVFKGTDHGGTSDSRYQPAW